ncbi:MAG: NAD(P)H-dependent oxidoreductase subunit E, partial [Pirellulales bacterium]|nr:NAD(P)H-dependent oxidoreductase subunit E [Pirellulales bacterium]
MSLSIVPALKKRQAASGGYLKPEDLKAVAEEFGVPMYRVESLVTFFSHFRTEPPPKVQVHVCRDMSCHLNGSV